MEAARLDESAVAADTEQVYRTLVEHANDGIAVVQDARFVFANPSVAALGGRRPEEMIGLHIAEVFHPADLPSALARYEGRVRGEPVEDRYEIRIRRPDGEIRWVGFSVVAMQWQGRPASLGVVTDVTTRKDLEARLHSALAERESILQSTLVGISLAVDRELRWVNRKLEELLGWGPGELIGQSSRVEFADDAAWRAFGDLAYPQIAAGKPYRGEVRLRRKDGSFVWLEVCGNAIDTNDLAKGTIWTYLDVSERRAAEAATLAALEQQRHMNELLARFVSMTSHEFRTPLAAIFSSAEILRCYAARLGEDDKEDLYDSIEAGVRRMTVMLENVLEFGRAQTGRLEFSPVVLDLRSLCEHVVAEVLRAQSTDGVASREIEFDWAFEGRHACVDERLVRQILGNLLSNAIKYSPAGGRVALEVVPCDAGLRFVVRDEGIGIPSEDLPKLFSTFHRARNVGAIAGTGLGLAIVKRAVECHGGQVDVETAPGRGSAFFVTLPLPEVCGMARILVVDEDGLIRSTLRRLLALEGHDVVEAVGGLPAIELALADPPDLVLCDLRMPDLDGAQVARHLRLDPRTAQVPVVILTGSGATGETHADAHVTKPFARDQLLAVISKLLTNSRE